MVKPNWIIAIDPGVNKSGVVLLDVKNKEFVFAAALSFVDTMYSINMMLVDISAKDCVVVVIEDSDMSVNWHYSQKDSKAKVAAKGRSVGMCHATARHLKKYCEWQQSISSTVMMKPLRKCWKGPDGKITHEEITQFTKGLPRRTNQEVRDAALLAWTYANLPIRLKL
jgi:hypothetical protein